MKPLEELAREVRRARMDLVNAIQGWIDNKAVPIGAQSVMDKWIEEALQTLISAQLTQLKAELTQLKAELAEARKEAGTWRNRNQKPMVWCFPCWFYANYPEGWRVVLGTNTEPSVWSHWMPYQKDIPPPPLAIDAARQAEGEK